MKFKIATWNVNSLRVRLPQLLEWLAVVQPDIVAIQETKVEDHAFPLKEIQEAGYSIIFSGQKTYNGVAIFSKLNMEFVDPVLSLPDFSDEQKRILAVTIGDLRILNLYVPNGQSIESY